MTIHNFKQGGKVRTLHRQEPLEHSFAVLGFARENHLAHHIQTPLFKKHMLCATQPDAFGAKIARCLRIFGRVGIGAHSDIAKIISPKQQLLQRIIQGRLNHIRRAGQDMALRAVDRDQIPFAQKDARLRREGFEAMINDHIRHAHHTGHADAAPNHRRMAR